MDIDALLKEINNAQSHREALRVVIEANHEALKEIRNDLGKANSQERVQAIINKVEVMLQDLGWDSQKIPPWVKEPKGPTPPGVGPGYPSAAAYGQYPINQPLNPQNPVPWPPGYDPTAQAQGEQQHGHADH